MPKLIQQMKLPLWAALSKKQIAARKAKWTRQYHNVSEWIAKNPGKVAGRLLSPERVARVTYYRYFHRRHRRWYLGWTPDAMPGGAVRLTEGEYLKAIGLDSDTFKRKG